MDNETKHFILTETEKLAEMIAKGFAGVDKRFTDVEAQFAEIREQMATKDDIRTLQTQLDRIEHTVGQHTQDIDRLTDDVRILKTAAGMP